MSRGQLFDLGRGYLVVAIDGRLPAQFSHVLSQVVNKGIIVVYYQYHLMSLLRRWSGLAPNRGTFSAPDHVSTRALSATLSGVYPVCCVSPQAPFWCGRYLLYYS